MKEAIVEFLFGIAIGALSTAWTLTHDGNLVTVHGAKDSLQTVEWQGKNYRLVPLDIRGKP